MKHLYTGIAVAAAVVLGGLSANAQQKQDFSKTDPVEIANFLCMAEIKLQDAQQKASTLNNDFKDGTPLSQVARHEASYLPAGFPQTNPGYDTCLLTGVGYYFDMDNRRQFNNCDPEAPRYFEVDCKNITARIVDINEMNGNGGGEGGGRSAMNYKILPFDPRTTNVCPNGLGRSARNSRDDENEKYVYETPKCEDILSTFKIDDYYLACDKESFTYNQCHASLSGTYRHRRDYTTTGTFCAIPDGKKFVNHVDIFNKRKLGELQTTASTLANDIPGKLKGVQDLIRKNKVVCDSKGQATSIGGVKVR
ncbi:MAG: hypothetical protein GC134_07330 [Proteobacteria bacterium]|nr:hypothetical protein [Pseudomonadota bacterium]